MIQDETERLADGAHALTAAGRCLHGFDARLRWGNVVVEAYEAYGAAETAGSSHEVLGCNCYKHDEEQNQSLSRLFASISFFAPSMQHSPPHQHARSGCTTVMSSAHVFDSFSLFFQSPSHSRRVEKLNFMNNLTA